jgi:predicted Zn-dependent protease
VLRRFRDAVDDYPEAQFMLAWIQDLYRIDERAADSADRGRLRATESLAVLENRQTGQVNLTRLRLAARLGPPNWAIEKRYVKALADLNFPHRALTELKTCIVAAPYRAESWQMMNELLLRIGRPNEAAAALAEAETNDVHLHDRLKSERPDRPSGLVTPSPSLP